MRAQEASLEAASPDKLAHLRDYDMSPLAVNALTETAASKCISPDNLSMFSAKHIQHGRARGAGGCSIVKRTGQGHEPH